MELNFTSQAQIVRGIEDNKITGLALAYYDGTPATECQPYSDGTYERLAPGCLDKLVSRGMDVVATFNHKFENLLGRTPATLKLNPTKQGLEFELDLPDTQLGNDCRTLIKRGDIRGCSFIAKPELTSYSREGNKSILTVRSFSQFHEITLAVMPYYTGTYISRSKEWHEQQYEQWLKQQETNDLIGKIYSLRA